MIAGANDQAQTEERPNRQLRRRGCSRHNIKKSAPVEAESAASTTLKTTETTSQQDLRVAQQPTTKSTTQSCSYAHANLPTQQSQAERSAINSTIIKANKNTQQSYTTPRTFSRSEHSENGDVADSSPFPRQNATSDSETSPSASPPSVAIAADGTITRRPALYESCPRVLIQDWAEAGCVPSHCVKLACDQQKPNLEC